MIEVDGIGSEHCTSDSITMQSPSVQVNWQDGNSMATGLGSEVSPDVLINRLGIDGEACNKKINDKDLENSCSFPYKRLSPHLGLNGVDTSDIERDAQTEPERRSGLLNKWKEKEGSDATYRALISALLEIDRKDDAEDICRLLKTSKSATGCPLEDTTLPGQVSTGTNLHKAK